MDEIRRFRLLVTPFVYVAWLVLGIAMRDDPQKWWWLTHNDVTKNLGGTLVALGIAVTVPFGYFLNSTSLWLANCYFRKFLHSHEEALPALYGTHRRTDEVATALWKHLRIDADKARQIPLHQVYGTASLAYAVVESNVGAWVARRWATFNIGVNSASTVVIAAISWRLLFKVDAPWTWDVATLVAVPLFLCNAARAWKETMGMLQFQALRKFDKPCRCSQEKADVG